MRACSLHVANYKSWVSLSLDRKVFFYRIRCMERRTAWNILVEHLQGIYLACLRVFHTDRFQPVRPFPLSTYAISTWYYSSSTLLFSRHEEYPSRCAVEVWVLQLYDRLTNLFISPQARTSLCRVGCRRIMRIVGR